MRNAYLVGERDLRAAQRPIQTKTYKPVSHGQLIDLTLEGIEKAGFTLDSAKYIGARENSLAEGRYLIKDVSDSEMQLQIGWQNSYDKSATLKFAIGTHIFICENGCVSGDFGSFKKKHTGGIQTYAPEQIAEIIQRAGDTFKTMQDQRDEMKQIQLNPQMRAELLGRLYIEHEVIRSSQLSIIRNEIKKPSFDYGAEDSMWELYQHTTHALKEAPPVQRMAALIKTHNFFVDNSNIVIPKPEFTVNNDFGTTDPAQISILDVIDEEEILG